MANTLKFGAGKWAAKAGSVLAYNDLNNNYKPLPFTFTRASSATRVNESGLIESVASGIPRVDYLNNANGHLLLEPSRTNIYLSSQTNLSAGSRTSKTGTTIKFVDGITDVKSEKTILSSGSLYFYNFYEVTSGNVYTYSFFAKIPSSNPLGVNSLVVNTINNMVSSETKVNLLTGEIISSSSNSANIEDYGGGWYRISVSEDADTTATGFNFLVYPSADLGVTTMSSSAIGDEVLYINGHQLELGSYATSYIPTSGSSVTRVADVDYKTSDEGNIIDSAKTIYVNFDELGTSRAERRHIFQLSGGTGSTIYTRTESSGTLTIQVLNSSVNQALFQNVSYNTTGNNKIAMVFDNNDVVVYVNGTQVGSDTSATIPTLTKMYIGVSDAGTIPFAGGIKDCKLYNTRLSNAELAALTSL